jgi:putative transposase
VVILSVHFHQLRLKVFAYAGEMQAQFLNGIRIKHATPVFGHEDQMHMHHKYALSTGSNCLIVCHRPIIICAVDCTKTLKLRIKDKHAKVLRQMAREVNQVWNHINAISAKAARPFHGKPKYLSGYDLQKFTAGYSKCDDVSVGSGTVQLVCVEYATRRRQFKKTRLNWRVSNPKSAKYSLGWIPFKGGHAQYKAGQIQFAGNKLSLWDSYGLSDYELRGGSFSEDSRGRWYFNVAVDVECKASPGTAAVGIDLGLKEAAVVSTGERIEGRWYRSHEQALGIAQRARKKKRVKAIHAKIKSQRKDELHQFSTQLVKHNAAIFVGDVASAKLVKTKMAKSTLDAGWSMLKTMLEYKSHQAGIVFEVVNENYTTQTCSCCGVIPASSPKGRAGLRIREWVCSECGTAHDRDTNAAKNILAAGHRRLAEGITVSLGR